MKNHFKLPNLIILSPHLSYSAKKLCASMYAYKGQQSILTKSVNWLAAKNNCCNATVLTDLERLVHFGFVEKHRRSKYSSQRGRIVNAKTSYICKLQTKNDFTFIPRSLFYADISFSAFTLVCYFHMLKGGKHRAFPSHSRITRDLGMDKRTTRRAVIELEKQGLIQVEQCKTKQGCFAANSYFLVRNIFENSAAPNYFFYNDSTCHFDSHSFFRKEKRRAIDVVPDNYLGFFDQGQEPVPIQLC